jgi:hypothetical protein
MRNRREIDAVEKIGEKLDLTNKSLRFKNSEMDCDFEIKSIGTLQENPRFAL